MAIEGRLVASVNNLNMPLDKTRSVVQTLWSSCDTILYTREIHGVCLSMVCGMNTVC